MSMEQVLKEKISHALQELDIHLELSQIVIEHSKEKEHGDFATNVAMQLARTLKKNPMLIAQDIVAKLPQEDFSKVEVARPGFINFFLKADSLGEIVETILSNPEHFGDSNLGKGKRINVEFVSANPTGDLHLGHARGAALGDTICRLYQKVGYDVTREFYVNDAGNQINHLGESIRARYHQLFGDMIPVPDDGYHGEDLKEIVQAMKKEVGDRYLQDSDEAMHYFMRRGVELELDKLNRDLMDFRVHFDKFSFETDIRAQHGVEKVLEGTKAYTYESEQALWLKTTEFGDDKDRVLIKSDGSYTYLLPDIAYHLDKLSRGYDQLIDLFGADHHGYISRMKGALQMFGYSKDVLEIELIQMVRLFKNGEEFKMSKRTGNAVSLRELCEEIGVDAARYFFVSRAASAHLDFDLNLATEQSSANPVYYAQYAHARLAKVLRLGKDIAFENKATGLEEESEKKLLKVLSEYPHEVEVSAVERSPYRLTAYIQKLAAAIHGFYTECKIIGDDIELTKSRMALSKAAKIVMKQALDLIGVNAPEEMK